MEELDPEMIFRMFFFNDPSLYYHFSTYPQRSSFRYMSSQRSSPASSAPPRVFIPRQQRRAYEQRTQRWSWLVMLVFLIISAVLSAVLPMFQPQFR